MNAKILVWDVPTRLFHWLLAAAFAGAYLTAESERYRDIHVLCGYTLLGLIAFRLVWGVSGTRYARFRSFAYGPQRVFAYLRSLLNRTPQHYVGHNPAGGWAVFLLLLLGVLTGVSGYLVYADLIPAWLEDADELHEFAANSMLVVVAVHIAGVVISSWLHRENLPRAMLTGYKLGMPAAGIARAHALIGAGLLLGVAGFWLSSL